MVAFPHCKINLGLRVLEKRSDGYHNLDTCFYPVPWTDVLEITPASNFGFSLTGLPVGGSADDNLCVRAWQLMASDFSLPAVHIHLHKIIPMGAGLGGGSSDAASVLLLLNKMFDLRAGEEYLAERARQLGSDCAFFMTSRPQLGRDKGDLLSPIELSLAGKFLVIVKPPVHVSTKEAYQHVVPRNNGAAVAEVLTRPVSEWKTNLVNDFEQSVFRQHPSLAGIKDTLYKAGAVYACMSGSGSSVFGIFEQPLTTELPIAGATIWSGRLPAIS